jgi:ABC-type transport system involved in multi-copper enzyme maturation permease subunit
MTMIREIVIKELRENLNTVRFYLILILTILLFAVSSITYVRNFSQKISDFRSDTAANESLLIEKSKDLLQLARFKQSLIKRPNPSELLSEANEKTLPNKFVADIFYLDFPEVEGRSNVLLPGFNTVDWGFIVAIVLSFLAFVLSYDAVSGEKEQKTLSLIFSNSVKTVKVFFGKFLGLAITLAIPVIVGALFGLIVIGMNREMSVNYGKVGVFLLVSLVFLSLFLLLGMAVSSLFSQSVTSAVTLLFIWIILSFVIPATGNLIANQFYSIPKKGEIEKRIRAAQQDIYDTKYSNTKAGNWNGDPFAEWVPLRAQWCTDIMNVRNQIYDDYIQQMISQVERTKWMTRISPVSVFRYLTEEVGGTGVKRFESFYRQASRYKQTLYDFIEDKDRPDEKSPHFLTLPLTTGSTGISRRPVEYASVPQFDERFPRLKDNLILIIIDLSILVILSLVLFITGYFLLVRYDKR